MKKSSFSDIFFLYVCRQWVTEKNVIEVTARQESQVIPSNNVRNVNA
jgi:hypothetical protein